jgi:quercetin dioxygenase-like cupin family protein
MREIEDGLNGPFFHSIKNNPFVGRAPRCFSINLSSGVTHATSGGNMKKPSLIVSIATVFLAGFFCIISAQSQHHVIQSLKEAQWGAAPPMLPAGAEIAVLSGNPMSNSAYAVRLKFPANYAIPAHSHPTDENVVVVTGALTFGMGDALNKEASSNKTLGPGGYALMPAGMNHFAYTTKQETTIVLYGQGPVEFKYVNPVDDPRTGK